MFQSEPASSEAPKTDGDGFKVPVSPDVNSKPKSAPPPGFKPKSAPPPGFKPKGAPPPGFKGGEERDEEDGPPAKKAKGNSLGQIL